MSLWYTVFNACLYCSRISKRSSRRWEEGILELGLAILFALLQYVQQMQPHSTPVMSIEQCCCMATSLVVA